MEQLYKILKGAIPLDPLRVSKEDIPEVERVILIVSAVAQRYWQRKVDSAVNFMVARIQEYTQLLDEAAVDVIAQRESLLDKRIAISEEVKTLLGTLEERLACPFQEAEALAVEQAAQDLLAEGALALGFVLSLQSPRPWLVARRELVTLLTGRVKIRRADFAQFLERVLTTKEARAGLAPGGVTRQELRALLGTSTWKSWGEPVVDAWAYRWHNVGRFLGARQSTQVSLWEARNPRDQRTTKFCWWVHGKVIRSARIEAQLRDYFDAVDRGDPNALKDAWPLQDPGEDTKRFRRIFANVGLPPYHFRCRTIVVPV